MKKEIKLALKFFLGWRLVLVAVSILAVRLLPFKPSFPYHEAILANLSSSQLVWHWANFDGPHYITIAEKGYVGTGLIQAFFPLYPMVMKVVNIVLDNLLYSGLIISNVCFLLSLIFFQKLLKLEKIKNIKLALLFLLVFPTSFYFGSMYSESLFFLLTVLAFLMMRQKKWIKAAVYAALASATRMVGIFIAPALIWEFLQTKKEKRQDKVYLQTLMLFILSLSGFILFCLYLYKNFRDPFYFATVQSGFGGSRQTDKIILFHQVVWRYLKMLFTIRGNKLLLFTITQEFVISLGVLALLIWAWIKKSIGPSYLLYSFFSFFLPTFTGNFSSMPRYVSLIFPIYFIFAGIKDKKWQFITLIFFAVLLIINTALFLRGFWIA